MDNKNLKLIINYICYHFDSLFNIKVYSYDEMDYYCQNIMKETRREIGDIYKNMIKYSKRLELYKKVMSCS